MGLGSTHAHSMAHSAHSHHRRADMSRWRQLDPNAHVYFRGSRRAAAKQELVGHILELSHGSLAAAEALLTAALRAPELEGLAERLFHGCTREALRTQGAIMRGLRQSVRKQPRAADGQQSEHDAQAARQARMTVARAACAALPTSEEDVAAHGKVSVYLVAKVGRRLPCPVVWTTGCRVTCRTSPRLVSRVTPVAGAWHAVLDSEALAGGRRGGHGRIEGPHGPTHRRRGADVLR